MTIKGQRGFALILVLILMAMGAMTVTPALRLASTSLKSKQIHTEILKDQYARDGAAEYAVWQLRYGDLTSTIQEGEEVTFEVVINGITTTVMVTMRTSLGVNSIEGAEGNAIRPIITVECDKDGQGFTNDCSNLPNSSGMVARYTIELTQISPDSERLVAIYDELPRGFDYRTGTVTSPDGSFTEILSVTPTNIGSSQDEIWKWDFSSSPITFTQGEVKLFTFEADIQNQSNKRFCNDIFLKMEDPPHEQAGKQADITIGNSPQDGCAGGGVNMEKFVDTLVTQPGVPTVLTYVINVQNLDGSTMHIDSIKDVLPQGGFVYCDSGTVPVCDDPLYKFTDTPFDPLSDLFTDNLVPPWTVMNAPTETEVSSRWELFWDGPGGAGWGLSAAGGSTDTFTMRFQTSVTLEVSGSYYNEVFADVDCAAPQILIAEGVTTAQDYCASYSWPTAGTLVPMYDVNSAAERTSGQGNISVGVGTTSLESWHVDDL